MDKYPKELGKQFFVNNAKSYESIVGLTTFGKDSYWKDEIIKKIPQSNSILDIACGTGILTFKIAERFSDAKITALDLSEEYLKIAKQKIKPNQKISFLLADAEDLKMEDSFDCITSSYIPKYCNPEILIEKCFFHLNLGGTIILHDFTYPKNKVIRSIWDFYFVVLHLFGLFVPRWRYVLENLPQLIRSANWPAKYKDAMERKGLNVEVQYMTWGTSAILTGTKKIQT